MEIESSNTNISIDSGAFYGCDRIEKAALSEGVTTIGSNAFNSCTGLKEIQIPNRCKSIGDSAFQGCSTLKAVDFGEGLSSIGYYAFRNCKALEEIYLPDSLTTMTTVPTTLTSAPFSGCTGLKKISVGGLEEIKDGMFYVGSQHIEEVEIRGTVGKIGSNAFNSSVAFSSNNSSNGHGFDFTTSSAKLIIREGVTSIGSNAFNNCDVFTEVVLEGGIIGIGSYAFSGCNRLNRVYIGSGVNSINSSAFNGTNGILFVIADDNEYAYSLLLGQNKNVVYASNADELPILLTYTANGGMFADNTQQLQLSLNWQEVLPDIPVPVWDGHIFCGWYRDADCTRKWDLNTVPSADTTLYAGWDIDVYTLTVQGNGGTVVCGEDAGESLQLRVRADTLLDYVSAIMDEMTFDCWYLDADCTTAFNGIMPRSDLTIYAGWAYPSPYGEYVFENGEAKLTRYPLLEVESTIIRLPETVNGMPLTTIMSRAFDGEDITELYLPASLSELEADALVNMDQLKNIHVSTANHTFRSIDGVLFSHDSTVLLNYPARHGTSYRIPDGTVEIGPQAFQRTQIRNIVFNHGLVTIGNEAFSETRINRFDLPDGIVTIGDRAFEQTLITALTIPDSVISVGESAFSGCKQLSLIYGSGNIQNIEANAFEFISFMARIFGPAEDCALKQAAEESRHYYNGYVVTLHYPDDSEATVIVSSGEELDYEAPEVTGNDIEFRGWYLDEEGTTAFEAGMVMPLHDIDLYALTGPLYTYEQTTLRETALDENGDEIIISETEGVRLTSYLSQNPDAIVPDTVEGYPVISLGTGLFGETVNTVIIPACVIMIEEGAVPLAAKIIYIPGTVAEEYALSHENDSDEINFTMRFVCTGGSSVDPVSAHAGDFIPGIVTVRTGYDFLGWYQNADLTVAASMDEQGRLIMPAKDSTVYAAWTLADAELANIPFTYEEKNGQIIVTGAVNNTANIVIPETLNGLEVTEIRSGAFWGNEKIRSVSIPGTVQTIPENTFRNCYGLNEISLGEGVEVLGDSCFSGCSALKTVHLPDSVTTIGGEIFKRSGITNIHLGANVYSMAEDALAECNKLAVISVSGQNTGFMVSEGVLYTTNHDRLIKYPADRPGASYTVADSCTMIGAYAFESADVQEVFLPDTVSSLGIAAFRNCRSLAEMPDMETTGVSMIPALCFSGCSSFISLEIPENIITIDADAFSNNGSLQSISFTDMTTQINDSMTNVAYLTIHGTSGSAAEIYADSHGYLFIGDGDVQPTHIEISETAVSMKLGETIQLDITLRPEGTQTKNITWSTSDISVVRVSQDGIARAVSGGRAIVYATTENGLSDYCEITVSSVLEAKKLILRADKATVFDEETLQMIVRFLPEETTERVIQWTSSDENVAITDENGLVTALHGGETVIRATASNGVFAEYNVTVLERVRTIEIHDPHIHPKETVQLGAIVLPESAADKSLVWSIPETNTVSCTAEGIITGIKPGFFTVIATAQDFGNVQASKTFECAGESVMKLPDHLIAIEDEAFEGSPAEAFILGSEVRSIGARTFADCPNLYKIIVPNEVAYIDESAFEGSTSVTILASEGSYAIQYAIDHDIDYLIWDD